MTKSKAIVYSWSMSAEDVDRAFDSIKSRAGTLRKNVHQLGVSIICHWAKNGSANVAAQRATKLLESVDGSHKQKIVNWFAKYGGLEYSKEDKAFKYTQTTVTADTYQSSREESPFDLTGDAAPQPFNDVQELEKLVARVMKRRKNLKDGDVIHANLWNTVTKAISEVKQAEQPAH